MSDDLRKTDQNLLVELAAYQREAEVSGKALRAWHKRLALYEGRASVLTLGELGELSRQRKTFDELLRVDNKNSAALLNKLEDFVRQDNFDQQPALLARISLERQRSYEINQRIMAAAEAWRAAEVRKLEERARDSGGQRTKHSAPPNGASFLLDLLLAKADRHAIPGDLEEYFAADLSKYGAGRARLLFWTRTFGAIAIRNPVCRWVLVNGLTRVVEWILRNLG